MPSEKGRSYSAIGLPKGMSRDDAYVQGLADREEQLLNLLNKHIPSITDEIEQELIDLSEGGDYRDEWDSADLALRICHCGERIDGFYEYVEHLREVFAT